MTGDESSTNAYDAAVAIRRYRDFPSSVAADYAATLVTAAAQFERDVYCDLACGFIGVVAEFGRDVEQEAVLVLAQQLEDLCVEQGALRALAYLSWRRGRLEEAASFQARALEAPDWSNDGMVLRHARRLMERQLMEQNKQR